MPKWKIFTTDFCGFEWSFWSWIQVRIQEFDSPYYALKETVFSNNEYMAVEKNPDDD